MRLPQWDSPTTPTWYDNPDGGFVGLPYYGSRMTSIQTKKTRMMHHPRLLIIRLSVQLFCRGLSRSLSGFSGSLASGRHRRRGCRSFHCGKRSDHVLQFALGSAFFGVFGKRYARDEAEHNQDAAYRPCGFFKEIGRLTNAHHLIGTSKIGDQTTAF